MVEFRLVTSDVDDIYLSIIFLTSIDACLAEDIKLSKEVVEEINSTDPSIAATPNYFYKCGEITTLTIDSSPLVGSWSVRFTSGSTATVLTMPNTVVMPDGFEVEANTVYEINVLDNYALAASWPVASS